MERNKQAAASGFHHHCAAVYECENCQTTKGDLGLILTDDGCKVLLCEDCAAEVRRLETLADELAALPSCDGHQKVMDAAESTEQLVNALRAHDMAQCVHCASTRATVLADRFVLATPAAVCCEAA